MCGLFFLVFLYDKNKILFILATLSILVAGRPCSLCWDERTAQSATWGNVYQKCCWNAPHYATLEYQIETSMNCLSRLITTFICGGSNSDNNGAHLGSYGILHQTNGKLTAELPSPHSAIFSARCDYFYGISMAKGQLKGGWKGR